MTVKAAPVGVGVSVATLTLHGSAGLDVPAQLNSTLLLYPLMAVSVPWKIAGWPGT